MKLHSRPEPPRPTIGCTALVPIQFPLPCMIQGSIEWFNNPLGRFWNIVTISQRNARPFSCFP